jgi:hypothetical protein
MNLILQIWGGFSYLINKILFSLAVNKPKEVQRKLKLSGWIIYILGVPAWVIILISEQNWIASSIEAGGIPAMLLGLHSVYKRNEHPHLLFDKIASIFTYGSIIAGVSYSLIDSGVITSFSQILEIGVMIGFLLGSYLLAKNNWLGWFFFMIMNGSMATLMFFQNKPLLAIQQLVSISFVLYAIYASLKKMDRIDMESTPL